MFEVLPILKGGTLVTVQGHTSRQGFVSCTIDNLLVSSETMRQTVHLYYYLRLNDVIILPFYNYGHCETLQSQSDLSLKDIPKVVDEERFVSYTFYLFIPRLYFVIN